MAEITTRLQNPPDLSDFFQDKTAVITGAGRGIGRATASLLAANGARVVIAEISPEGADCAQEIQQAGGEARFIRTDVSDPQSVKKLVQQTQAVYGSVHILINNAIVAPISSVLAMEVELWDRVMAVNLRGTFLTCKLFLPGMLSISDGVIVNMISTEALPYMSAYMTSKQGIAAFSRSLAGEVGDNGIRVVAFAPGFVDTPGLRAAGRDLAPHMQLDEQSFMSLSFHPAYPGAMPVEDAALATALLISQYCDLYHGDQVNGYVILERAGLITAVENTPGAPQQSHESTKHAPATTAVPALALEYGRKLAEILAATEAEFNQLPMLVRPLARQGFKSKSGRSLADWQHTLPLVLQTMEQSLSSPERQPLPSESEWIMDGLAELARYYREVPAETGRFTRDQAVLQQISVTSQDRENTVQQFKAALEACLPE